MDDLKLFGKTEKQLDILMNTVRVYRQYQDWIWHWEVRGTHNEERSSLYHCFI